MGGILKYDTICTVNPPKLNTQEKISLQKNKAQHLKKIPVLSVNIYKVYFVFMYAALIIGIYISVMSVIVVAVWLTALQKTVKMNVIDRTSSR